MRVEKSCTFPNKEYISPLDFLRQICQGRKFFLNQMNRDGMTLVQIACKKKILDKAKQTLVYGGTDIWK